MGDQISYLSLQVDILLHKLLLEQVQSSLGLLLEFDKHLPVVLDNLVLFSCKHSIFLFNNVVEVRDPIHILNSPPHIHITRLQDLKLSHHRLRTQIPNVKPQRVILRQLLIQPYLVLQHPVLKTHLRQPPVKIHGQLPDLLIQDLQSLLIQSIVHPKIPHVQETELRLLDLHELLPQLLDVLQIGQSERLDGLSLSLDLLGQEFSLKGELLGGGL